MNTNVVTEDVKNEQARTPSAPFTVERLGARLGAEIHGLDLKKGLDPETFKALEAALIEHKIIVLRNQHLTTEQHVAISRPFGDLEVHREGHVRSAGGVLRRSPVSPTHATAGAVNSERNFVWRTIRPAYSEPNGVKHGPDGCPQTPS